MNRDIFYECAIIVTMINFYYYYQAWKTFANR